MQTIASKQHFRHQRHKCGIYLGANKRFIIEVNKSAHIERLDDGKGRARI